jgi:hypothetical protein
MCRGLQAGFSSSGFAMVVVEHPSQPPTSLDISDRFGLRIDGSQAVNIETTLLILKQLMDGDGGSGTSLPYTRQNLCAYFVRYDLSDAPWVSID